MRYRYATSQFLRLSYFYVRMTHFLNTYLFPLLLFFMRIWMARIFFYSGHNKILDWDATVFLFHEEYKVPIIPAEISAFFATSFELACPILLVMGLASRLATIPMLIMTAVIQFTYLDLIDHTYWAMILGIVLLFGPGAISIDYFIKKKISRYLP